MKSEETTMIACCSVCFIFWFTEIIKRNYICIYFPLLPHAKASMTYATTAFELFRFPMGIVEDIGGRAHDCV